MKIRCMILFFVICPIYNLSAQTIFSVELKYQKSGILKKMTLESASKGKFTLTSYKDDEILGQKKFTDKNTLRKIWGLMAKVTVDNKYAKLYQVKNCTEIGNVDFTSLQMKERLCLEDPNRVKPYFVVIESLNQAHFKKENNKN